jgi:hypothetical protein
MGVICPLPMPMSLRFMLVELKRLGAGLLGCQRLGAGRMLEVRELQEGWK